MLYFRLTDDNLKEDFTTRFSFCNRFSCFEGGKKWLKMHVFFYFCQRELKYIIYFRF